MTLIVKDKIKPAPANLGGQHWYTLDGKAAHEVPNASRKGQLRPTTVKDARKLNLFPSVTNIIKALDKEQLNTWHINLALEYAFQNNPVPLETCEQYQKRIHKMVDDERSTFPTEGRRYHQAIENAFRLGMDRVEKEMIKPVLAVKDLMSDNDIRWPRQDECEVSIVPSLCGYGGTLDGITDFIRTEEPVILDYKTTRFLDRHGKRKKLKPYSTYSLQISAYRNGLMRMPKKTRFERARCFLIYIATDLPGEVELHEIREEDIKKHTSMFFYLAKYFAVKNDLSRMLEILNRKGE